MCTYDDTFVAGLEEIAKEMAVSMENMLSIVSPKREPLCGNLGAANQAELLLDRYHKLMRDYAGD